MNPESVIQGILLGKVDVGENFIRLLVFTDLGLKTCLLRKVRKLNTFSPPDLFDDVERALKVPNQQGLPFVKDFEIFQKRRELALDRKRFEDAGFLARFYLDNGEHLLDPKPYLQILDNALRSFMENGSSSTTLLKALYLFARSEGLPVKESWLMSQKLRLREIAIFVLSQPVKSSPAFIQEVPELLDSLCKWFNSDTELRC